MAYKTDKYGRIYRAGTPSVSNESRQTLPSSNANRQNDRTHRSVRISLNNSPFMSGVVLLAMYLIEWMLFALINAAGIWGLLLMLLIPFSWIGLPLLIHEILERFDLEGEGAAWFGLIWIILCIMAFLGPNSQGSIYSPFSWLLPLVCAILIIIGIILAICRGLR
jgi:hypothetical protein